MPKLPGVDPETFLLVVLGGAILGGLTTAISYVGMLIATQIGEQVSILPGIEQTGQ
ncbi:MAG: hypothetical protein ABIH46_11495 [Chloroflexota bacterium]